MIFNTTIHDIHLFLIATIHGIQFGFIATIHVIQFDLFQLFSKLCKYKFTKTTPILD